METPGINKEPFTLILEEDWFNGSKQMEKMEDIQNKLNFNKLIKDLEDGIETIENDAFITYKKGCVVTFWVAIIVFMILTFCAGLRNCATITVY